MMTFSKTLTFVVLMLLAVASCKKDSEPAPDFTAPFVGSFEVQYDDPADNYVLNISNHAEKPNTVKMLNFGDFMDNIPVYGTVAGNKMTIATQSFKVTNGKTLTITGEGILEGTTLKLHFVVGGDYELDTHIKAVRQ